MEHFRDRASAKNLCRLMLFNPCLACQVQRAALVSQLALHGLAWPSFSAKKEVFLSLPFTCFLFLLKIIIVLSLRKLDDVLRIGVFIPVS
jgi:hypothetical protein